jgi:lipopolysaccharide export system protein LptA
MKALMRLFPALLLFALLFATPVLAEANIAPAQTPLSSGGDGQIEVTADESLEWYQDQRLYVARGNAKAIRGTMTVEADILTAHERNKTEQATPDKVADATKDKAVTGGSIDRLTAEGRVHITDPRQQVFGEHAIYDFDRKVAEVTGSNLKYVTAKDVVTARNSLEYYEDKNMAVARGKAIAVHDGRHVEGDVLTAHFTQTPAGQQEMSQMTAEGNVTVLTATDVARGDKAVYDVKKNAAVLTGHVRVTRQDTQLTGDKAEVDFASGQSRLLNEGKGRVRALLSPKSSATLPGTTTIDTGKKADQKAARKVNAP